MFAFLLVAAGASAVAAAPPPGDLGKTATDATTGNPASTVATGGTINWTIAVPQKSGAASTLALRDQIETPQAYVPNSLKVPPTSTLPNNPGFGLTGSVGSTGLLQVDGRVPPTGAAARATISPPATSFATPKADGDGYTPILLGANVYNLFHHFNGGVFINCFDKATGARCASYPTATYLSTQPDGKQPFGSGPNDFVTARQNSGYLDRATGRYYLAGANLAKDIGFLCFDLINRTGCGWTPIQPGYGFSGSGTAAYPYVQNGAFAGGKFYAITRSGRVICVVVSTMTACPNQGVGPTFGFDVGLPGPAPNGTFPSWGSTIHLIGNQIIVTMPTVNLGHLVRLSCLDPTTDTKCAGAYPQPLAGSTASNSASGALLTLSAAGAVTGYCINLNNGDADAGSSIGWDCFTPLGATAPVPPTFPNTFGFSKQGLAEFTTYKSRVYYPSQQRTQADAYVCYDFATLTPCTGAFPVRPTLPGAGGVTGALIAYSLVSDPVVPTCIWELGDFGQYFQFDAITGGKCTNTGVTAIVNVAPFFCDKGTQHVTSYDAATIAGITPAQADPTSSVTVFAADNSTPLPGFNALPFTKNIFDLSAISYPSYLGLDTSRIFVSVALISPDPSVFTPTSPTVSVSYRGDGPQICYQTKIPQDCSLPGTTLANTATATLDGVAVTPVTAKIAVTAAPGTCSVHASVRKITDPPGKESGWTFTLGGPGVPPGGVPVITTGSGAIVFTENGQPFNLAQGGYIITENPRTDWDLTAVASDNALPVTSNVTSRTCSFTVTVANLDANDVFSCVFTNVQRGALTVTKSADWNGSDPGGVSFQICITGPSFPTTVDCKTFSSPDSLVQTWTGLLAGTYTVTEPAVASWTTTVNPSAVSVAPGGVATAGVTNKHAAPPVPPKPPGPPLPVTGVALGSLIALATVLLGVGMVALVVGVRRRRTS